ncbi:MAG: hypothetical protein OGM05_04235 [Bacteroides ovatus]|jgi:hypothetical protein|nr:MAG: hypothetical protein OGM05_04235 [Bacteroides ovatus]DAV46912.1 MAG TPA: bacterial regulatory protein [Caudoviricetes sp.]
MIIKTYKANTNISINVVLPSKKNLHIAFTPLSDGSSVFTTDNEVIQKSIEKHYKFGKLFKLHASQGQSAEKEVTDKLKSTSLRKKKETPAAENVDKTELDNNENVKQNGETEDNAGAGNDETVCKVKVSDIAAAKDYLADKFGISRTSMRSTKAILEQAAAHGIEFEGL